MPGLDDIDEDDCTSTPPLMTTTAPAAASSGGGGGGMTMDDIFGGLGEAPKPKPVAVVAAPAATLAAASPPPVPAPVSTSPKPPGGDLDDFFSAPPAAAAAQPAQPAKKKPASDDLLGGGSGGATLSEAAHLDGVYVPPPGVLNLMSHYEVLSLREASATPDAVSKAYKKLAIAFHPDKRGKALTPEEDLFFKAVTTAHEVLADQEKRAEYDASRKAAKAGGGSHKDDLFAHFA